MLQVKKSRAKKILGPAPCVLKYGKDGPHDACMRKLCAHPGIDDVDIVVVPELSPHAAPTFLTCVSKTETTYLHVTNFTDGTHTQVIFSPVNDNQICVLLAAENSRITLGIFDVAEELPSATITSFGDETGDARLCFMQFGPWTWALSEELVVADGGRKKNKNNNGNGNGNGNGNRDARGQQSKASAWATDRPAVWFGVSVVRLPLNMAENPDNCRLRAVLSRREHAITAAAPMEGGVKSFSVQAPGGAPGGAKVLMQELPHGVSRWFSIKNGVCVWSGFGRARNEAGAYTMFWRSGALFAKGVGFEVCVAALGEDETSGGNRDET